MIVCISNWIVLYRKCFQMLMTKQTICWFVAHNAKVDGPCICCPGTMTKPK